MMFEKNKALAESLLEKRKHEPLLHLINGEKVTSTSNAFFDNTTPIDNSFIGKVASGDAADIDLAAKAATAAFKTWRNVSAAERAKILRAIAENIIKHADEIAVLESYDTGQAIRFMSKAAIRGAENFLFYADKIINAQDGLSMPDEHHINYSMRQPLGPVGIITPWNTPFMLSTWKIAPALAAGCTVVHKPAELSPITASYLADLAEEAGLPRGVWNVVHGMGESAGKALCEHPDIKAIAFIGETTTGTYILKQGAATLKRTHLELGGKNPVIVFGDADLEKAMDAAIFMIYSLNGERCTSSSRLLVQRNIYESFMQKLEDRVKKIKVGHPLDPATEIGPLIHSGHFNKVKSYVGIGKKDGATLAAGGYTPEGLETGNYFAPTLFKDATKNMRLSQEEIFGPFLTAIPFDTEAEALEIANSVKYGLTAYIWTNDIGRATRMARDVEAGMVWVNSENVRHLPTPFGGVKNSGIGRDGGDYSFEFYMETKNISIAYGTHKTPKLGV